MHLHGVGLLVEGFRDRVEPFSSRSRPTRRSWPAASPSPSRAGTGGTRPLPRPPCQGVATVCRGPRRSSPAGRATHLFLSAAVETDSGREPIRFPAAAGAGHPGPWRLEGDGHAGHRQQRPGHRRAGDPAGAWSPPGSRWRSTSWSGRTGRGRRSPACSWARPRRRSVRADGLPRRRNEGLGQGSAELPGVQQAVGEMRMRLDAARATLLAAVARPPDPDPVAHYGRMAGAKLFTCQTALEVCTLALRTAGGSGCCAPARWSGCCATPTPACCPCPRPTTPPSSGWAGSSSGRERPPPAGSGRRGPGEPRRGAPVYQSPSQESGSPPVDS